MIALILFLLIGAIASFGLAKFVTAKHPPIGQFLQLDYQGKPICLHYLDSEQNCVSQQSSLQQNKPTIILIHGATGNLQDFHASIFTPLAEKYRVIAFDRPGLGYSERPRHGDSVNWCSPREQMAIIRSAIRALNIDKPIFLGHSLAGPIVLDYLMHHGQELSAAILLSPVSHPWPNGVTWYNYLDRAPILREIFAYTWLPILGYFATNPGLKGLFFPEKVPEDYREKTAVDLFFRPRVMLDNFRDQRLLCEYVTRAGRGYRAIQTPVKIITGTEDSVVMSWLHAEKLSYELGEVDWLDLPNLGHSPHHCRSHEVIENIEKFIAKNS